MKKLISILMSIFIIAGLCVTGYAEEVTAPDVSVFISGKKYSQQYILNEHIDINAQFTDENIFDRYEKLIVDCECNKDVVIFETPVFDIQLGTYLYTETQTGYRAELSGPDGMVKYPCADFFLDVIGKGTPDVKISAVGITADGEENELVVAAELPNNKVYEKEEIPHIVTNLQPPVFPSYRVSPHPSWIYTYAPQTAEEISRMLSSSDEDSVIKYLPADTAVREYVVSGDVFALEFEGKLCDYICVYVMGDANSDGIITSSDAREALRYTAKLENDAKYSSIVCDTDRDGKVTAADARMILRVAAQIDYFRLKNVTLWVNQSFYVDPLVSASGGGYMWRCTVSDESAIEITEKITPSVDNTGKPPEEIIIGAPALQNFILKPLKQGKFDIHFELIRSWEDEPIKEFGFTVVVDGILQ